MAGHSAVKPSCLDKIGQRAIYETKAKPLEHNHYKLNQRAYKASFFLSCFDSHGERDQTTILTKTTGNCLDKIGQRAITKEKNTVFKYIHNTFNQREYKTSFQLS